MNLSAQIKDIQERIARTSVTKDSITKAVEMGVTSWDSLVSLANVNAIARKVLAEVTVRLKINVQL